MLTSVEHRDLRSHWLLDRITHHLFARVWCQPPPFTASSVSPFLSHSSWLQAVLSSGLLHPAVKVCSIDPDVGEHDRSPLADRCCSPCQSISYSSLGAALARLSLAAQVSLSIIPKPSPLFCLNMPAHSTASASPRSIHLPRLSDSDYLKNPYPKASGSQTSAPTVTTLSEPSHCRL